MAQETESQKVTLEELTVTTLAMTDTLVKLCIAKSVFTDEEFRAALGTESVTYFAVLKRLH